MPRYYFHVRDGHEALDQEGVELAGIEKARALAIVASGEMLRDLGGRFWDSGEWRMWVMDESGATVCELKFSAESGLSFGNQTQRGQHAMVAGAQP